MHPIERLRYVARAAGADPSLLVRETAAALADMVRVEPVGLVSACRRLVERHVTTGPVWWLTARVLTAGDPGQAAWVAATEMEDDPTPGLLTAALPDDATVTIVGWPDVAASALHRRGDAEVLVVDAMGDGSALARRLGQAGTDTSVVPDTGVAAAAIVSDLVLIEALAAGPTGILATSGSHAAAAGPPTPASRCGRGRRGPGPAVPAVGRAAGPAGRGRGRTLGPRRRAGAGHIWSVRRPARPGCSPGPRACTWRPVRWPPSCSGTPPEDGHGRSGRAVPGAGTGSRPSHRRSGRRLLRAARHRRPGGGRAGPPPAELAARARRLLADLAVDGALDAARRRYLAAQVEGLRTTAVQLAGEPIGYADEVEACYGVRPRLVPEDELAAAHRRLDEALPGSGPLAERYIAWREAQVVPVDRLRRRWPPWPRSCGSAPTGSSACPTASGSTSSW